MRILGRDGDILYGYSMDTYKFCEKENFDYESSCKCNCIYKFHVNAIKEIPNWQDEKSNQILEKYNSHYGNPVTGIDMGTCNDEYIEV
jgi:hypothetical protein